MEKITYQISSRAAILLGRESVSKVDGAIIELIKPIKETILKTGTIAIFARTAYTEKVLK